MKPYHRKLINSISGSVAAVVTRLLCLYQMLCIGVLMGNPSGEVLVQGMADFQRSGGTLTIEQLTDRAITNWDSFSIDSGEVTRIIQPSAAAAMLNRVTGGDPSAIHGTLQANGAVYLINPNGILVGPGGRIDSASFVASTLNVTDDEFMAGGDLNFSGDSTARVENYGTVRGIDGDVVLIAREVVQAGTVEASGSALLAAGSEVLLREDLSAGNRIYIKAESADGSIEQSGQVEAARAELAAAGGNAFALAINSNGLVRAQGIEEREGEVWLTARSGTIASSGTLEATKGDTGGTIHLHAPAIELSDTTVIKAEGEHGGGTIYIGTREAGEVETDTLDVAQGALINADAITAGDGGEVILWSEERTDFEGTVSARGGSASGDGGFVEVSSAGNLRFDGIADLRAESGSSGLLLLDPDTVEIINGGAGAIPGPAGGHNQIDPATVLAQLALANVVIEANVSIDIVDSISGANAAGNSLTFRANAGAGNIKIMAPVINIAGGDLIMDGVVTVEEADVTLTAGKVQFNSTVTAAATAQSLTLDADDVDINNTVDYTGKSVAISPRTAGVTLDLGARSDTQANTLELSNTELMHIKADKLTLGDSTAGDISISQRISPSVDTLHLITSGTIAKGTPKAVALDMSFWQQRGPAGNGNWDLNGANEVVQRINGDPTFFVTNDPNGYVGAVFEGTILVATQGGPNWDAAWNGDAWFDDNDYVGFVFGFKEPSAATNDYDFYLFDWDQEGKPAGGHQTLARVTGNNSIPFNHSNTANFNVLQQQGAVGWQEDVSYDFKISYEQDNVTVNVKGGAYGAAWTEVMNYDNPDPVNSAFQAGAFGFFNYSQSHVRYSDFKVTEQPALELSVTSLAIDAGGAVNLTERVDVANVAIRAGGDINFRDTNGFNIASIGGVNGISTSGHVTLESQGTVNQNAVISANTLELKDGTWNLNNTGNSINQIAGNVDAASFVNSKELTIGTAGATTGITAAKSVTLRSLNNTDIVVRENITADTSATAAAADATIVLAADGDFHNLKGANPLSTGNGHFLIYSTTPDNNTLNGMAYDGRQYNRTYSGNAPATITPANDSLFLYKIQPTVTVTSSHSKQYAAAVSPLAWTADGLLSGDTLATVLSGAPGLSSPVTQTSNAGSYTIQVDIGTLVSNMGYNLVVKNGTYTVTKVPLTVTVNNASKDFFEDNPAFTATYSGFVLGQDSSVLTSLPTLSSVADKFSLSGTYAINANGGNATNYTFNVVPGTLTVTGNPGGGFVVDDDGNIHLGDGSGNTPDSYADNDLPGGQGTPGNFPTQADVNAGGMFGSHTSWHPAVVGGEQVAVSETGGTVEQPEKVEKQVVNAGNYGIFYRENYKRYEVAYEKKFETQLVGVITHSTFDEVLDIEREVGMAALYSQR